MSCHHDFPNLAALEHSQFSNARRRWLRLGGLTGAGMVVGGGLLPTVVAMPGSLPGLRIVVGFPQGGTVDGLARRVAERLRGAYATDTSVENVLGAGGTAGIVALKNAAAADGSVLALTPSSVAAIHPLTHRSLPWSPSDLAPVSLGGYIAHGLAVGPLVPASVTRMSEFVSWAKANPEQSALGNPSNGSIPHLVGVLIARMSNLTMRHVPFRGAIPGIQDMLAGKLAAYIGPLGDLIAHAQAGKLRILAVSSPLRSPFYQQAPTLRELGIPLTVREWYGFFASSSASANVTRRASAYLQTALSSPQVQEFGRQAAIEITPSTPEALAQQQQADAQQWKQLIKITGFTADA